MGPPSAAALPTLTALGESPTTNETGVNPNLSYLAVTWLNPIDTSPMAAVLDTQVDADAYLVPSTTDQLEEFLGERAAPASERSTMFADLDDPGARVVPAVTRSNTTSVPISNSSAPGSMTNPGKNSVNNRGQAVPRPVGISPPTSTSEEFVEPLEPVAPEVGPPAPAPPERGQAPTPTPGTSLQAPQPAGQAPAPGAAPQTAPPAGQPAAGSQTSQPTGPRQSAAPPSPSQRAGQSPGQGPAPHMPQAPGRAPAPGNRPTHPVSPPDDFDIALDQIDARVSSRLHEGDVSNTGDTDSDDSSPGPSVLLAAAVVGSGGLQVAMQGADRSASKGRSVPRWLGAERPLRRETATPSR